MRLQPTLVTVEDRALQSGGISNDAILRMVQRTLERHRICGERIVDVGCGTGNLCSYVSDRFDRYAGTDVIKYAGFPPQADFYQADLDSDRLPLPDGCADVVVAIEVIEHLENPRAFMRKLVRLAKPGGRVMVTTPNQISLLSLLSLVVKERFNAFQDVHYPAHLTALLPVDLTRIAAECGLRQIEITYSLSSRIPLTSLFWPSALSRAFPRRFSENVLMIGTKTSSAGDVR